MTDLAPTADPAAHLQEEAAESFAHEVVPEAQQGSGWRIFFIVAGSQCGLAAFLLSAQLAGALGLAGGARAAIVGGLVLALLGGISAYAGSRTRMSLALLAGLAFGHRGARLVRLLIALALVGWFGVAVSVLGATAAGALADMTGLHVPPPAIAVPVSLLITWVALRGAQGLERLGMVLIPLAFGLLGLGVALTASRLHAALALPGSGALNFGQAVSATVGTYIVGAVIQPDYGRFVRRPAAAALGAGAALALVFPLVLIAAAIPGLIVGKDNLIAAMVVLGFGLPALVVVVMGSWIDASACLYSGGLSLANQFPRFRFQTVILACGAAGVALALLRADTLFVPFLMALGVALPPVAAVQVTAALFGPRPSARGGATGEGAQPVPAVRPMALLAWAGGTLAGVAATYGEVSATGIAALDSILVATVLALAGRFVPVPARR